jgi:type IV secretory pathway TrbD component
MTLRTIPIRRAGNRESLFLGGDRKATMLVGLISSISVIATQDLIGAIFGIVLWFFGLAALRLMAKSDPRLIPVYMRNRPYSKYYAARSTPFRTNPRTKRNQ